MKPIPEIKQEIRNALPLVGIKDTILAIKKYLPEHAEKFSSLLLIEGRYRDIEQRMLQGVLSLDEVQLETNKIRADLLTLIDSFEEKDFQEKSAAPKEPTKPKTGKILYRIPNTMQVNEEAKCIIRVAFTEAVLLEELDIESIDQIKSIRISEAMAAQVIDPNSEKAFSIRTFSEEIQFVEEDYFTEWLFFVKPLLKGTFSLLLKISVIEIKMGKERKRDIVMEERVVITTDVVEEEPPFKSADYDFVSPYAPLQSRGIEPTPVPSTNPSTPKSTKKRPFAGIGKAIASMSNVLIIGVLVVGSIIGLNYGTEVFNHKGEFADYRPAPPKNLNIPSPDLLEPSNPSMIVMDEEPEMASVETKTITEYKEELLAYADAHASDKTYAIEVAAAKREIQYLEYQEALKDTTSFEVIDYLDKYAKGSLNCLYCRQAEELKTFREGQDEFKKVQKIDNLLRYLQLYPVGKYRREVITMIDRSQVAPPYPQFPIVLDSLKWNSEQLKLTFLKGEPPFNIAIQPSNIGKPDTTISVSKLPISIPFKVPNLERGKYELIITDGRNLKALIPLDSTKIDIISSPNPNTESTPETPNPNPTTETPNPNPTTETPTPSPTNPDEVLSKLAGEILVKKGRFTMGSNIGKKDEKPVHAVTIQRDFYIYETETTFNSYDAYCTATGTPKPKDEGWGRENHPVINVSWVDAVKYCNWLSSKYPQLTPVYKIKNKNKVKIDPDANGFRLPSEAEWEYAAKGGHRLNNSNKYAGSRDNWESVAYHNPYQTGPVKSKQPNELGIYDMSGNVYEWTQDFWLDSYKFAPKDGSAYIKNKVYNEHTIRGGRFNSNPSLLRVTHRTQEQENTKRHGVGFRVVRFTY